MATNDNSKYFASNLNPRLSVHFSIAKPAKIVGYCTKISMNVCEDATLSKP